MSNVDNPPNPYFSGINFNPSFYSIISNYLTEAIANSKYLRLIGGILTGNLGIKRTPQVELDVNGKAIINNSLATAPGIGILGSTGTRLILFPGTVSLTPYALGYDANTLWYGSAGVHAFYTGTTERMRIKNDGNVGVGTPDPLNILQVGNAGRLRISNGPTDYTLIGSKDVDDANNTRIVISGFERAGFNGNIDYISTTSTGIHRFYTNATNERMRMINNGNIGIGTDNPARNLQIHKNLANQDVSISFTDTTSGAGASAGFAIGKNVDQSCYIWNHQNTFIQFSTNNIERMRISANGNVGIGTNNPNNIFQVGDGGRLRISNGTTDYTLIGTKETDDNNNTRIVLNGYLRGGGNSGNIDYIATTTGTHKFLNGIDERMRITDSGRIGIGTNNPGNILQVGDGARLRISNGPTDYTLIGTKEADDNDNTRIVLNGYTRAGLGGKIQYRAATATGEHLFYYDASTLIASISFNKAIFYRTVRTSDCNYENEGVLYSHSTLINVGGTSLSGYFIPVNNYTNSFMACAFSHSSTVYTYWRGHVTIGNNNQIFDTFPMSGSNMLVESFTQQTTLTYFIRVIPTV